MRRHMIFCNYCRYYSRYCYRYYYHMTTVATTVVTENRMATHAISLMSDARCRTPFLRKNRSSWTTTTTQRSVQRSLAQHATSCRIVGILQNHVSLGLREHEETTVPGKCDCSY